MSDTSNEEPAAGAEGSRKGWMDEAQDALDRAADALHAAWDATRETRISALESAKSAVEELGEVVERGVAVAKERWEGTEPDSTDIADEAASWGPAEDAPEEQ